MISLNTVYAKHLLNILYAKKKKDVIYANNVRNAIKTISSHAFVILIILKNNVVSLQPNNIIHIAKTLIFKNLVLNVKKYNPSIHQEVNKLKLTYLKLYQYFYSILC